jgi:hypothetical protein
MSCGKPFCTCCQRAYLDGLNDGFALGFRRGYNAGYISGYVDAARHLAPPAAYVRAINNALDQQRDPKRMDAAAYLLPTPRPRKCTCFGVCTCIE